MRPTNCSFVDRAGLDPFNFQPDEKVPGRTQASGNHSGAVLLLKQFCSEHRKAFCGPLSECLGRQTEFGLWSHVDLLSESVEWKETTALWKVLLPEVP